MLVAAAQLRFSIERVKASLPRLLALAQGGTAVGTGLNAKRGFAEAFAQAVADDTGLLTPAALSLTSSEAYQILCCDLPTQLLARCCTATRHCAVAAMGWHPRWGS